MKQFMSELRGVASRELDCNIEDVAIKYHEGGDLQAYYRGNPIVGFAFDKGIVDIFIKAKNLHER